MASEAKREVWVVESDRGPEDHHFHEADAKAHLSPGERVVRYVPAASDQAGKADRCRQCNDAYADQTVTGCMSCVCFRKAASASGKAQAESELVELFHARAQLHHGETGYFFELFGKPATVETFKTVREAAHEAWLTLRATGRNRRPPSSTPGSSDG